MSGKKKIGVTFGSFDLCHAGHAVMFKECKEICDYLIVGLQSDPTIDRPLTKNRPIQTLEERKTMLEAIRWVDEVFVYDTESELYAWLKNNANGIDVRIIGNDWKGKNFTGYDLPIKVYYNQRGHNWSSSELRERVYSAENIKRNNKVM